MHERRNGVCVRKKVREISIACVKVGWYDKMRTGIIKCGLACLALFTIPSDSSSSNCFCSIWKTRDGTLLSEFSPDLSSDTLSFKLSITDFDPGDTDKKGD